MAATAAAFPLSAEAAHGRAQAWQQATGARLADGRLHLHHGPIDLIVSIEGEARACREAEQRAARRFGSVLIELTEELNILRQPLTRNTRVNGVIAERMVKATRPFLPDFITPMAAVAGSVADEICSEIQRVDGVTKAIVNNGGDVAVFLAPGESVTGLIAGPGAESIALSSCQPYRGVATSGWPGRSHSFGIADLVTVVATCAARADAAATLIANKVDLPGHPAIERVPASDLSPDTDLSDRLVTVEVGLLTPEEHRQALSSGLSFARRLHHAGVIGSAILVLGDETVLI